MIGCCVNQLCGQAGIMVNRVSPAILGEQGPGEKPLFWADFAGFCLGLGAITCWSWMLGSRFSLHRTRVQSYDPAIWIYRWWICQVHNPWKRGIGPNGRCNSSECWTKIPSWPRFVHRAGPCGIWGRGRRCGTPPRGWCGVYIIMMIVNDWDSWSAWESFWWSWSRVIPLVI